MSTVEALLADLAAEHECLDDVLAPRPVADWALATPAEGWTVRDQVSHLTYFDASAALALVSPGRFAEHRHALLSGAAGEEPDLALGRRLEPGELLASWRSGRVDLIDAATAAASAEVAGNESASGARDPARHRAARIAWYGPDMSLASFVTARIMETWAHGQDVRDGLGLAPAVSERLRHICHLGVAARRYAHAVHGIADGAEPVRVEAVAPDGTTWTFGPEDAAEQITGSALGLALVFTQRRHPADTDVEATGEAAARWLTVAQAFAGPPGTGRRPGHAVPAAGG